MTIYCGNIDPLNLVFGSITDDMYISIEKLTPMLGSAVFVLKLFQWANEQPFINVFCL